MKAKQIDQIKFTSPINVDNGYVNIPQGEHESIMTLFEDVESSYWIDWENPVSDEYIGIFCKEGTRIVTDYDGVFEVPEQAIRLLERNGFNCSEIKES